jgi:serine/threonine-protein kinase
LEAVLPDLSDKEQYVLGLKAGEILQIIHSIPAPKNEENWEAKCNRSLNNNIKKYHENEVNRFEGSEHLIKYIEQNRDECIVLLKKRPQCFRHGDYSVPNMMYENSELRIIDFDRYSFGDPWSEFFKTIFSARISPHFTTGQLRGYFNGEPPPEFFMLMAFYTSYSCLGAISWAIPHGQEEVDFVVKLLANILKWHDNMNNPIPTWYLKDFHVQWMDGIPYKLKAPFDFSFLGRYGKVFKVFDNQGSGNICFGISDGDKELVRRR